MTFCRRALEIQNGCFENCLLIAGLLVNGEINGLLHESGVLVSFNNYTHVCLL